MNEKEMTIQKKKLIYSILAGAAALLLIAAIVLTVCFATRGEPTIDTPPVTEQPGGEEDKDDETDKPAGGEEVRFVLPSSGTPTLYGEVYYNETLNKIYRHKAVDFTAEEGEEVVCIAEGTVLEVSLSEELGNLVTVDHGDGLVSAYRFVEPAEGLKAGDKVEQGDVLGTVAAPYGTEAHGGAHLHFELMLDGESVDPADHLDLTYEEK